MTLFHIFFSTIIGMIAGKALQLFWELIFIHKKINYHFYFFLNCLSSIGFLVMDFLLSVQLPEFYYHLFFRLMMVFLSIVTVSWSLIFYPLYFKKNIFQWLFMFSSFVIICTFPFEIFSGSQLIIVHSSFFGLPVVMHYPFPRIMFFICEINIFVFYTGTILFILFKKDLSLKQKIVGVTAFSPGVLFLLDTLLFLSLTKNYPEIPVRSSSINLIVICLLLLIIFLFPNFQNYFAIKDKVKEIKIKNRKLRKEVQKRTREIEQKNRQRTDLFINLTHEIKTPLTLIQNYLNAYIKDKGKDSRLDIIYSNIDKLSNDINNFFDSQKFEFNKPVYNHNQTIDLSYLLENTITLFSEYAHKNNCVINGFIEKKISIKASAQAIDRVINNLLDNAVKYSTKPGTIELRLTCDAGTIRIKVKNNGEGICKENLDKIFEPYYQIINPKKNSQGMGMGLSIVRNIIHSLNGSITVQSIPDDFTEFIIDLPGDIQSDESGIEVRASGPLSHHAYISPLLPHDIIPEKKTLLILEDNRELLAFLIEALKDDYNILYAFNGIEGMEQVQRIRPDLIISDIMMDQMDGYQFFAEISKENKFIPFVFLTAKSSIEDKLKGLSLGALDFICKPFHIDELKLKIKSLLSQFAELKTLNKKEITQRILQSIEQEDAILLKPQGKESIGHEFNVKKIASDFRFSSRETQVFDLLINGHYNKEIASTLNVSISTIKKFIFQIYRKLGVSNRIELSNFLRHHYGNN
jgi:signal transduction histidine kinase/DNA-binding NarL/FixJ family response regulator